MDYLSLILFYINFYSFTFLIPQSLPSFLPTPPLLLLLVPSAFFSLGYFMVLLQSLSLNSRFLTTIYLICWDFLFSFFLICRPFTHLWPNAQLQEFHSATVMQRASYKTGKYSTIWGHPELYVSCFSASAIIK